MFWKQHEATVHVTVTVKKQRELNASAQFFCLAGRAESPTFLFQLIQFRKSLTDKPRGLFSWSF